MRYDVMIIVGSPSAVEKATRLAEQKQPLSME